MLLNKCTANSDIKRDIVNSGFYFYEVANALGIADTTFSRKLRKELSSEEKAEIRNAIDSLKAGESK